MIESIFIISNSKEITNGRLFKFITNFKRTNCDLKTFLFLDSLCRTNNEIQDMVKNSNIEILFYNNILTINQIFAGYINYKKDLYKTILVLETDCALKYDFLSILNNDLLDYDDVWIYGSYYYGDYGEIGISSQAFRFHMNGVAIYNRTEEFLKIISEIDFNKVKWQHDGLISKILFDKKLFMKKCIDSRCIINLSPIEDINIDYRQFKKNACIVHTKNNDLLHDLLHSS